MSDVRECMFHFMDFHLFLVFLFFNIFDYFSCFFFVFFLFVFFFFFFFFLSLFFYVDIKIFNNGPTEPGYTLPLQIVHLYPDQLASEKAI